jgi:GT2 family glycosyltransferase
MKVKISVIVPTYRRPELVRRCVEALLLQRINVPYEILVVIDGMWEQLNVDEDNVRVMALGKNCGPAAARNFGFQQARGELIIFTDDDCIPQPDFLSAHWTAYSKANKSYVAFTGKVIVPIADEPTDYQRNIKQLEAAEFITANCALSRDAFNEVGGFDEQFTMAWREDSDLHFKLLWHDVPIIHVPHAIVHHPVRDAKWNVSLQSERKNMFNALLFKKFPQYYSQRIKSKPPLTYYAMVAILLVATALLFVSSYFAIVLLVVWSALVINFALSRICRSSSKASHVITMLVTSAIIPFLSVYWNIYGNIKFKSRLL